MSEVGRKSRVGFVVVKVCVAATPYFLMRLNPRWRDINFIGGHEKSRDGGDLKRTARRELWEEVPSIRGYSKWELEPLTGEIHHGPIFSRSRGDKVEYDLQFFLLRVQHSPVAFVELLSARTRNVWLREQELLSPQKYRVSGLVELLDRALPNGLEGIPYSSATDLGMLRHYFEDVRSKQLEFALK